ncbi:YbjN domain-containing protein [Pantanalinema sp. GBBB05]|uniref:YbjN domain-containing protein n=1 Tax=Pantanalinema sp. GBBB05 TaxID=2604139 RepID=UPI001D22A873|nr:YbjN domain-containing protein [Pantanalinema sp. GBBB05]
MTIAQPDLGTASSSDMMNGLTEAATATNPIEVIETVIDSLDSNDTAMVTQSEGGHIWKFCYGTVEVFVQLTGLTSDDTLTVWSTVLKLPAKDEPGLMRRLLEMNWADTLEARFGIMENQVVVVFSRILAELSPGEISRAITIVATLADDNDEPLQSQFGA